MQGHRKLMTICCAAVLTLGLAACGGGGDDTPVTETQQYMDLKDMADGYKADVERLTGELEAANGRIGSADDPDSLMGRLTAATARIGSADDPDSLLGMLAAEQATVTSLMTTLGDETDPDAASVRGQLAAAMARIGSADEAMSLLGQIASLTARIGSADDPDSLLGMLAAEQATIGSETEAPDSSSGASLYAQLNAAKARIAELEGGTAPDQLGPIVTAAMTASGLAADAETDADKAADEAEMADDNRATIQTGEANSVADAMAARTAANTAMTEAGKALAAYNAAKAAANTEDARKARNDAEDARDDAIEAQGDAEDARDDAVADAKIELKIDDKTKSVGATSITVGTAGTTVGTATTGKIGDVTTPGAKTVNGLPVPDGTTPANVNIGVTVDSNDDTARLTLVQSYLGTAKQMQFLRDDTTDPFDGTGDTNQIDPPTTGQDLVPNSDDTDNIINGSVTVPANASHNTADVSGVPQLAGGDFRAADATTAAVSLYYLEVSNVVDTTTGDTDDGIDQTRVYLERNVQDNAVTYSVVNVVEVTVDAPSAFEHIHYGLWNGISGTGANTVSDLGIGFVQNYSGEGMTETMPNISTLTYNGNYVANVQAAHARGEGAITRMTDTAIMTADMSDGDVDVTLTGLITLEGDIDGNMFSGTKAAILDTDTDTAGVQNTSGLATDAKLEGSFSGGFFGTLAAEAGGVFDFSTKDNEDGAVRGAFGGAR